MYRLGVATGAELETLRLYFDSVAVEASRLQQRWAARDEPVWVVVSSPEHLHTGERVMEWVQEACELQPWRLKQGFDWATSGNRCLGSASPLLLRARRGAESAGADPRTVPRAARRSYPQDASKWKAMTPFMSSWGKAMRAGDTAAASACIDGMEPILVETAWYSSYAGKVNTESCHTHRTSPGHERRGVAWSRRGGAAQVQGALQAAAQDGGGKCVAVCIDGGPVTRVEHRMMKTITENVHV